MGDLDDDVLMQLIDLLKKTETMRNRQPLLDKVWKDLDLLVREIAEVPMMQKLLEKQLLRLRDSVAAVLTYDKTHSGGDEGDSGGALG